MKYRLLALSIGVALTQPSLTRADSEVAGTIIGVSNAEIETDTGHSTLGTVSVTARLDKARNQLSPDIGTSQFVFDQKAIAQLPLGASTSLNQVLLRAPGVVNDSYGQLHVRGDHADLQYRINGVIIPESISGFGQALDTHVIDHLSLLTGALPAQYGYRTAGIVDITTKSGIKDADSAGIVD